jgi:peroxiredoxin
MTGKLKVPALVVLLALTAYLSYAVKREAKVEPLERLRVGDLAPDFTLGDLEDERVSLTDHRTEVVVLDFWTTTCARRDLGMALLDSFLQKQGGVGVVVLSINADEGPETVRRALGDDSEHQYRVLLDSDGRTSDAYGLKYVPTLVVVDQQGKIAWIAQGYSPDLAGELARQLSALGVSPTKEREGSNAGHSD